MFIRLTNGKPEYCTIGQLRRDIPRINLRKTVSAEILARYGVYPVKRVPAPAYNELTQMIRAVEAVQIDGEWTQQWEVIDLPIEQQTENLRTARAEAYRTEADPLFFRAQRGETKMSEWSSKVQEIRNRFPYSDLELPESDRDITE